MKQVEERYISFEASKMAYRDIKNSIDTAKREGKEEGLAEGMEKGLADGMNKGFAEGVDPGAEPLALCSGYPVLPERSVSPLCRLCSHGLGEEPHPLQRLPRPEERWQTGEDGQSLHPYLSRMDRTRAKVHP